MKQRILVAVIGIPALLGVLCFAPTGPRRCWCRCCASSAATSSWPPPRRWKRPPLVALAAALSVFTVFTVYFRDAAFAGSPIFVLMPWLLAALLVVLFIAAVQVYGTDDELTFPDLCAVAVSGLVIPPWLLSCLLRLRMLDYGAGLVLIPLVSAFMSDALALFGGMLLGKTKLAPRVSPKKTREGAVSGLVGGMVGMILYRIFFFLCTEVQLHLGWCVLLGLVGAVLGQLGDLSFSCVKRQCGIKDYGRLLPGHGGVLDRFDSVIFAAR